MATTTTEETKMKTGKMRMIAGKEITKDASQLTRWERRVLKQIIKEGKAIDSFDHCDQKIIERLVSFGQLFNVR